MQIYFSGTYTGEDNVVDKRLVALGAYRLCSFAYPKDAYGYLSLAEDTGNTANMLIDSGAFTSWSLGKPVSLNQLMEYSSRLLEKYGDKHNFSFISLDVIPGSKQTPATETDIKNGMKESISNYHEYQNAFKNHSVLPVYHSGEPTRFRDYFLNYTDHICLSMNQRLSERDRVDWANRVQVPDVKLHGLAATGTQMVKRVDWYSVDSAGWLMVAALGSILWSHPNGKLSVLSVSAQSPTQKQANKHITTVSMKQEVIEYIESKGFNLSTLAISPSQRMLWNIGIWLSHNWLHNHTVQRGLFDD